MPVLVAWLVLTAAAAVEAAQPITLSAWIGTEYDDGVASAEVDSSTSKGDSAGVIELAASVDLFALMKSESGLSGRDVWLARSELDLAYSFHQSWRDEFDEYDLRLHLPSLRFATETASVDWGAEYRYGHTTLGDDTLYQSQHLVPFVGGLVADRVYVMAEFPWEHRDFVKQHPVATLTSERDADRGGLRLRGLLLLPERRGSLTAQYAVVRQSTTGPAFDYTSNGFDLGARVRLPRLGFEPFDAERIELRAGVGYSVRDYDGARRDRRTEWLASLDVPIVWRLRGRLGYERFESESPLPAADYRSNVVSLMIGAAY